MVRRSTISSTIRTLLGVAMLVVCLAPLQAQDSSAKVLEQIGQVSLMDGGYLKPLSVGNSVQQKQMIVTGPGSYARFQVSDGSTFEVFPNSRVIFRPEYGNWRHLIDIVIGRIKIFIQHEPNKPNPNDVSSPTAVISVRGTVFDVVVEDDDTTVVSVDEGVVSVRNMTAPGRSVDVNQGESIRVIRNQPLAARQVDKSGAARAAYRAARDAAIQLLLGRRPVVGAPGTVPGGAQGDRGKGGTTPGTGPGSAPTTGPGSAPASAPGGGD